MTYQRDWETDVRKNHVSPRYNNSFDRYMLNIKDVIDSINQAGYPIDGWQVQVPDGNGGTKPLPDRLDDIINNNPGLYRLEVISTGGYVINDVNFTSVLIPTLYRNNKDITDTIKAKYFKWTRTTGFTEEDRKLDAEWNLRWAEGAKEIPITKEDVRRNAVFNCYYTTEKEEVIWVMKAYQKYMALTKEGEIL